MGGQVRPHREEGLGPSIIIGMAYITYIQCHCARALRGDAAQQAIFSPRALPLSSEQLADAPACAGNTRREWGFLNGSIDVGSDPRAVVRICAVVNQQESRAPNI